MKKYSLISDVTAKKAKEANGGLDVLTAEEIKFSRLLATGLTPTTAYRQAFPMQSKLSYDYVRRIALKLAETQHIKTEVETAVQTRARLARLAEDRIEQILVTDESMAKGSKVAEVAMFMYDHSNGKAQSNVNLTATAVTLSVSLSDMLTSQKMSSNPSQE